MKITLLQKIKLVPVFIVINFLWFVESFFKYIVRGFVILIVVFSILIGFKVNNSSTAKAIQNLPLLFVDSPEVLGTQVIDFPIFVEHTEFPVVTAKSVLVSDLGKGKILADINGEKQLAPASTTKLMTALVALDLYETNDYLEIPKFCTEVEGQKSGFENGEIYSVEDLLKGLLINSSADAACTLSISKVGYHEFVSLMNKKAADFGMTKTSFTNPIGLDGKNSDHISTAYDLSKLARKAVDNSLVNKFVQTKAAYIYDTKGRETYIWNTNNLLWEVPGSIGVKTGTTEEAGEVLIYRYKQGSKDLLIIVMGSYDRFGDTIKVLNWTLTNHSWGN